MPDQAVGAVPVSHTLGVTGEELVLGAPWQLKVSQAHRPLSTQMISQSHLPPKRNFHGISETLFNCNCFSVALAMGCEAWFEVTPRPVLCCLFHLWALFHITVGWEHPKAPRRC